MRTHSWENAEGTIGGNVDQKYNDHAGHELVERMLAGYKKPKGDQAPRYEAITRAAHGFAQLIADLCPPSAETTLAIRAVAQARMQANQSIAVNEA